MLKGALMLASAKSSVRFRDMPYISDRLFQALRTEGLNGAARLIKNRIEVGGTAGVALLELFDAN